MGIKKDLSLPHICSNCSLVENMSRAGWGWQLVLNWMQPIRQMLAHPVKAVVFWDVMCSVQAASSSVDRQDEQILGTADLIRDSGESDYNTNTMVDLQRTMEICNKSCNNVTIVLIRALDWWSPWEGGKNRSRSCISAQQWVQRPQR